MQRPELHRGAKQESRPLSGVSKAGYRTYRLTLEYNRKQSRKARWKRQDPGMG